MDESIHYYLSNLGVSFMLTPFCFGELCCVAMMFVVL